MWDKVKDYIPEFSTYVDEEGKVYQDARLWHLLTHTSGLPPYCDAQEVEDKYGRKYHTWNMSRKNATTTELQEQESKEQRETSIDLTTLFDMSQCGEYNFRISIDGFLNSTQVRIRIAEKIKSVEDIAREINKKLSRDE